ncbi:MAG: Transcriptional regulator, TrmB, partial [Parcubacteria group bacterium GW2011_GWA2_43_11]
LVERRYAKAGQAFRMSYSIYDDKVVFISSAKEAYGFVVQSKEFAELMLMQFELLWSNSKK